MMEGVYSDLPLVSLSLWTILTTIMAVYLKIATLNTGGLRSSAEKRTAIFDLIKENKIDICLLQETNLETHEEKMIEYKWGEGNAVFNSKQTPTREVGGLAILAGHKEIKFGPVLGDEEGRVMAVEVDVHNKKFHIVNIHAPNTGGGHATSAQKQFFENLDPYLQTNNPLIIGGDFNFVEDPTRDRLPPANHSNDRVGKNSFQLIKDVYELRDPSNDNDQIAPYFTRERNSTFSRIDRFYIQKNTTVKNTDVAETPLSDHKLVHLDIEISSNQKRGKGRWCANTRIYQREDFREEIHKITETLKEDPTYQNDIISWWKNYKNHIKKSHIKFAKIQKKEILEQQQHLELNLKVAEINVRLDPYNSRYRTQYQNAKKILKNSILTKTREKMAKNRYNNFGPNYFRTKEFYRQFRQNQKKTHIEKLKDHEGQMVNTPQGLMNTAHRFYKDLYKKQNTNDTKKQHFIDMVEQCITQEQNIELNNPMADEEIKIAIRDTKIGRAPGLDGIPIDFYKEFIDIILEPLSRLLNKIFLFGETPYDMKMALISLAFKKDDPTSIKCYRPISLLNNDLKIMTKVMSKRMEKVLKGMICETQYACPGKKISTAIHLLRDIYQHSKERRHENYIVSIDFIKAYDSVDRDYLAKLLDKFGFRGNFLETLKSLFTGTGAKIIINGFITKTVKLRRGIKQGDALSLYLFLIALEPLMRAIKNNSQLIGVWTPGGKIFKTIGYADDLNTLLSHPFSLRVLLNVLKDFGEATGLKVQPEGTTKCSTCLITTIITPTNQLPALKYTTQGIQILGSAIGEQGYIDNFLQEKFETTIPKIEALTNPCHTYNTRAALAQSKILSLFTYNAQFHPIPGEIRRQTDQVMRKFAISQNAALHQYYTATHDTQHGGYGITHVSKNAELFSLLHVFHYIADKLQGSEIAPEFAFAEFYLGHQLAPLVGFRRNNTTPHSETPSWFYRNILDIIQYYKITREELIEGKLGIIYKRICNGSTRPTGTRSDNTQFRPTPPEPNIEIHSPHLPHYLQTFSYRRIKNILPLNANFSMEWGIQGPANCTFCNRHPETNTHLFLDCHYTSIIWAALGRITQWDITDSEILNLYFRPNSEHKESKIILVALATHIIWKQRNNTKHNSESRFANQFGLIRQIWAKIKGRLTYEQRRPQDRLTIQLRELEGKFKNFFSSASRSLPD